MDIIKSMNTTMSRRAILSLLLPFSALALVGCKDVVGGKSQPPTTEKTRAASSISEPDSLSPSYPNTIRVWRDYSGSTDDETLSKIADDLVTEIARHKEKIVGIEMVRFANGGNSIWAEIPERFIWGAPPQIKEFQPDLEIVPAEARMFKEAMKKHIDEQKRRYDEQRAQILNEYKARVDEQLKKFKEYLLQSPSIKAPCTQFTSFAARMKKEDLPLNLTITDGWADCQDESDGKVSGVAIRGKHVIIQLDRKKDSQANDGEIPQREGFLRILFPSAEIFPAYMPSKAVDALLQ